MSSLEEKIFRILKTEHIHFIQEQQFCDDKRVKYYRYDFYVPKYHLAIEVHGQQHYEYSSLFHKTRSDFTKAQERDRRKISYCLAHGIKLYCIPYWEIDNLHSFNDICNEKFLATTKFHNDNVWRKQKNREHK